MSSAIDQVIATIQTAQGMIYEAAEQTRGAISSAEEALGVFSQAGAEDKISMMETIMRQLSEVVASIDSSKGGADEAYGLAVQVKASS